MIGACTGRIEGGGNPSKPSEPVCPDGWPLCDGKCADISIDADHCGACGAVCSVPSVCLDGACTLICPAGQQSCDTSCVDTRTDLAHCGACSQACAPGMTCAGGVCQCPTGKTLCEEACVDTQSSAQHCGACGVACAADEACLGAQCGGPFGDSCGDLLATGVSIREIAIYQAGKIPLAQEGGVVARADRPADVIQGKPARVSAFVDLGTGWVERVVSARLLLDNAALQTNYFAKLSLSQASVDNDFASAFNFDVNAADITATTRYAVEIVECGGTPAGAMGRPRFPGVDKQELWTRATGILRLHFVPFDLNGRIAKTDKARLDAYRDHAAKMYPIAGIEYTVGEPLTISEAIEPDGNGWGAALDQLSARHEADDAPNDLYYYGLAEPTEELDDFCGRGCTAGMGYQLDEPDSSSRHLRVSFGLSYGEDGAQISTSSAETMAHELGHNHGRPHSPCGNPSGVDPHYPYDGARLGWWGFQVPEKLHDPAKATDIMGYCNDQWVSDYVYRALTDRVEAINEPLRVLEVPASLQHFRFLLVDAKGGVRWGLGRRKPRRPTGDAEPAEILDVRGDVIATVTVYRTATDHLGGAVLLVPEQVAGWHAIRITGAGPLTF